MPDPQQQFDQLRRDFEALKSRVENDQVFIDTDVFGLFEVVSAAPTGIPKTAWDQVKIYKSGATYRLYVYDYAATAGWRYVALT